MENLTTEQRDQVLRFLLHRMPMNTRHELMLALPMAYAALYPRTANAVLVRVRTALAAMIDEGK
jgi:hypothetical protein